MRARTPDPFTMPDRDVPTLTAAATGDPLAYAVPAVADAPATSVGQAMSVAQAATRGIVWMTVASVASKLVGFVQLIVLAWFLRVEDFGLLTMANTIVAFGSIPLKLALEEILIQRYRRFELWRGPAFWLSVATGGGTMLLLLLAAPLGARFYGDGRVAALMAIAAATTAAAAVMAVPYAKLSAELRFGAMSALSLAQIVVQTCVALPLAALGFGAFGVAIAGLTTAVAFTAGYWWLARVGPVGLPHVRRWRYFVRDSGLLQGSRLATAIASNVDFITVGRLGGAGPLGVYSYAYGQSLQAMRLVAANAAGVLFPSLSSLGDDPARKYAGFLRGLRLVLPVLVPFCAVQAAVADPLFRFLFRPEYWPGIVMFQVLSVGGVGVGAGMLYQSCLLSLRRNDLVFYHGLVSAAAYAIAAPLGYVAGGTLGVSIAVAAAALFGLATIHVFASRAAGSPSWADARVYARPAAIAVVASLVPWWLVERGPLDASHRPLWRLAGGGAAFALAYPAALWCLAPATVGELARRVAAAIARPAKLAAAVAR